VAQVIVEANDDAFGFLQLSAPAVNVAEDYVGPIINVTRIGGIFADVSVKFRAVPMTARVGQCGLHHLNSINSVSYKLYSRDCVCIQVCACKVYVINSVCLTMCVSTQVTTTA
jgi:hypothetical protein